MTGPAALLVGLLTSLGAAAPAAGQEAFPGPCAAAVSRQLRAWGAAGEPRDQAATTTRHWPTRLIGTWVTESRGPAPVLLRVSPTRVTRLAWTEGCVARREERARPAVATPRFTDADLTALVSSGRAGVVYVWSPHMPLSVDGYRAIAAAAAARGLTLHAMLQPGADRAFAQASLARGGLPRDALRIADSVELSFRDVHLHAPSILVFAHGRIVGDAWPGYHSADEYGAFLDRMVAARR